MSETLSAPDPVTLPGTPGAIGLGLQKLTFSFKFAAALLGDLTRLDQWLQDAYQLDTALDENEEQDTSLHGERRLRRLLARGPHDA